MRVSVVRAQCPPPPTSTSRARSSSCPRLLVPPTARWQSQQMPPSRGPTDVTVHLPLRPPMPPLPLVPPPPLEDRRVVRPAAEHARGAWQRCARSCASSAMNVFHYSKCAPPAARHNCILKTAATRRQSQCQSHTLSCAFRHSQLACAKERVQITPIPSHTSTLTSPPPPALLLQ
jgi:hypothetical protein